MMMTMPSLKKKVASNTSNKSSNTSLISSLSNSGEGQQQRPPTPPLHTSLSSSSSNSSSALRSGRFGSPSSQQQQQQQQQQQPTISLSRSTSSLGLDDTSNVGGVGGGGGDAVGGGEDDPLMTLFRVHHNNRVQFDLSPPGGGGGGKGDGATSSSKQRRQRQQYHNQSSSPSSNNNTDKSKFNIKKFVRSSIFTNSSNSNSNSNSSTKPLLSKNKDGSFNSSYIDDDDDDDPENALIKKMLMPSQPKRLGSFLKAARGGGGGGGGRNGIINSPNKGDIDKMEDKFLMSSSINNQLPSSLPTSTKTSSSPKFTYSSLKHTHNLTTNASSSQPTFTATTTATTSSSSPTKQSKERIAKLLKKAQHSHKKLFRYRLAMRYYLLALKEMNTSGYNDSHPLITKVLKSLNDVHHAQTTLANSANIVKMGIHHEDAEQLVKALKMYTVAYRMRRDALGVDHPSLPVLLNMMGSVQVKRGEYVEAMQIFHLSLKGRPDENGGRGRNKDEFRKANPLTTSVTLRDMGMILEHKGDEEQALRFYHSSLRYAVKFRSEIIRDQENDDCNNNVNNNHRNSGSTRGSNGGLDDGSANGSNMSIGSGSEREYPAAAAAATSSREDEFDFLDQLVYSTENVDDNNNNNDNNVDTTTTNHALLNQKLALFENEPFSLDEVRMAKTTTIMEKAEKQFLNGSCPTDNINGNSGVGSGGVSPISDDECGEMELFFEKRFDKLAMRDVPSPSNDGSAKKFYYDELFVKSSSLSSPKSGNKGFETTSAAGSNGNNKWEGADVDIAMTLHQIGQIHRRSLRYAAALSAYNASLRGMKEVLGSRHGNIAAILGNIGNLYMETGDYDEAFKIYQEVLGIETLHLGLSHPEVAVTLHNIATIECSRGNFAEGVSLYRQVVDMQKIRFGPEHITVAVTLSCLADANEKLGNLEGAIRTYDEALQIRMKVLGKSHIDVGRILHKLGRLASSRKDYRLANVYIMKAAEIYADNKLKQDHPFLREMARDMADIQAGLAFSGCKGIAL